MLALGLVALATHPLTSEPAAAASLPATGGHTVGQPVAQRDAGTAQTLSVVVPHVTFQAQAQRTGALVRTAVLVNTAQPAGTATIDGTTCSVPAQPGVAAWLECPDTGAAAVSITVRLSDGRVFRSSGIPVAR